MGFKVKKGSLLLAFILIVAVNVPFVLTESTTITVPDDFSTIQGAVNAAKSGDTIFVKAGTYCEIVTVEKDNLALTGENKATTIIDGSGGTNHGVINIEANRITVSGFTITNSYDGICLSKSSFSTVSGNIITACSGRGIILVDSSFVTVSGNTLTSNYDSIEVHKSSFVTVSKNTMTDTRFGIGTSNSFNNTFSENTALNCYEGIYIWDCAYTTAYGNTVTNSTAHSISATLSSYCALYENTLTNSAMRGISFGNSSDCVASKNTIKFTASQGIHSFYSSSITVTENTLTSDLVGIGFYMASGSTVFENTIDKCKMGITVVQANNNKFYNNSIIDNQRQAVSENSVTTWDDDYPSGGNYWSDYNGTDADGDGLGDTPYIIDVNNQDRYPLMEPYNGAPSPSNGTWTVDDDGPADFATIQEAINAASPEDTIYVKSGNYHENVVVDKSVSLIGESNVNTIIHGDGTSSPVVKLSSVTNVVFSGFAVANGGDYGIDISSCSYANVAGNFLADTNNNGILVFNSEHSLVSGNTINSTNSGMLIDVSYNCTISNNIITHTTNNGIRFVHSPDNKVSGNTIIATGGAGIAFAGFSDRCIVSDNTILFGSSYGIVFTGSGSFDVHGNTITNSTESGIHVSGSDSGTIYENVITNGLFRGINLLSSDMITIYGNTITQNTYAGVFLSNSHSNTVSGNKIDYILDGVSLDGSNDNIVSENIISNTRDSGLELIGSFNNTFSGNTITNTVNDGIHHVSSPNCTISGNTLITSSFFGIHIYSSSEVIVTGNNIENIAYSGIRFTGSLNSFISKNTIINATNGIELEGSDHITVTENTVTNSDTYVKLTVTHDNLFYHNNFINNPLTAPVLLDNSIDTWDDGYPSGGNYWSDYVGTDADGDGIGDVPYVIDTSNQDNYPLMEPFTGNLSITHTLSVNSTPSGVTFTSNGTEYTAPWSETFAAGTTINLTMPESYIYEGKAYNWSKWSDENTNRTRTVTMNTNLTLTGIFTAENEPAAITILSPENRTYTVADVPLEFSLNGTVTGTKYELDWQENVTIFGNTTLVNLTNGQHCIMLFGEDTLGNEVWSDIVYFTVDVEVPSAGFILLSPENTTYSTSDVPLIYIKNETCVVVSYALDGQLNYTEPGNTTLTGLSDGVHQLVIYVNYTNSFIGDEISAEFTVNATTADTTPPTVSITSPANTTYTQNEIPLNFTVNEPTDWIAYSLDGQANVTVTTNTTLTDLADGPHQILVFANDTSGNTGLSNITYFTVSSPITGVTIISPENTTYNVSDVPFSYLVNETSTGIAYILDNQPEANAENVTVLSGLAEGTHKLTVVANFTGATENATVWFAVDTTAPSIANVTLLPLIANGSYEDGAKVNATVTDAVSGVKQVFLNYTIDNTTWTTAPMIKLEDNIWNGTIPGFPHSTNVTYTITAEDAVGNTVTNEELFGQPEQYQVLPELMPWVMLPLFIASTVLVTIYRKKLRKSPRSQPY